MPTLEELKTAQQQIADLHREVFEDITAKAQLLGYALVKADNPPRPPALKAPQRLYRNPDNPEEVYKGKGKRPAWLQQRLEAGARLEDFAA